jgi:gas vesicle protein
MMNDRDEYGYDNGGASTGQVMTGIIVGAAIGATLGLILAPRAGRDTRRIISESGDKVRRQASNAYQQASSAANEIVNRGRTAVSRGREAFNSARDRAADEVPRRVEDAVDDIRNEFS